jgi:hypothetical protein
LSFSPIFLNAHGSVRRRAGVAAQKVVGLSQKIVIVESPAKAKTINKYLGSDFTVLAYPRFTAERRFRAP